MRGPYSDLRSILVVIPARKGSKGVPRKNTRQVAGKPLVLWTIETALDVVPTKQIHVSTDDDEVVRIAKSAGIDVPFRRPQELAQDESEVVDAIEWALSRDPSRFKGIESVVLLEPTSPIRDSALLQQLIFRHLERDPDFTSTVTVGLMRNHPALSVTKRNGVWTPLFTSEFSTGRRQSYEAAYFPFGFAYISDVDALLESRSFIHEHTNFQVIPDDYCFEIDSEIDIKVISELLMERGLR